MFSQKQDDQLKQLLDPKHIKKRQGFSYIEGCYTIQRANDIFGYDGWSREMVTPPSLIMVHEVKSSDKPPRDGWKVAYSCAYRVRVGSQVVEDIGFGENVSYISPIEAHETAIKASVTDALKRCLRSFGDQFGNELYDKTDSRHTTEGIGNIPSGDELVSTENPAGETPKTIGQELVAAMKVANVTSVVVKELAQKYEPEIKAVKDATDETLRKVIDELNQKGAA